MRNCSKSVTSCPPRASSRAAAQPMTPAPTTATRIAPFSWSAQRNGDLHAQFLRAAEMNLTCRPVGLAVMLLHPAVDGLICAEDLWEIALAAADLGESDLSRRKLAVAVGPRHADLDRTVVLGVD